MHTNQTHRRINTRTNAGARRRLKRREIAEQMDTASSAAMAALTHAARREGK